MIESPTDIDARERCPVNITSKCAPLHATIGRFAVNAQTASNDVVRISDEKERVFYNRFVLQMESNTGMLLEFSEVLTSQRKGRLTRL